METAFDTTGVRARLLQAMQPCLDPGLLAPAWRADWSAENPTYGFCSVASEAAWFLLGGSASGWLPCVARGADGGTHWWLETRDGQGRLDLTAEQYSRRGVQPPYAQGHRGTFMGQRRDPDSPFGFGMRPGLRAGRLLAAMLGGAVTTTSVARLRRRLGLRDGQVRDPGMGTRESLRQDRGASSGRASGAYAGRAARRARHR